MQNMLTCDENFVNKALSDSSQIHCTIMKQKHRLTTRERW